MRKQAFSLFSLQTSTFLQASRELMAVTPGPPSTTPNATDSYIQPLVRFLLPWNCSVVTLPPPPQLSFTFHLHSPWQ